MVIVFGAAGFIGTYLVNALADTGTSEVLAVDIDGIAADHYKEHNIPFVRMDITEEKDFERLPAKGVSCVVNLACLQPDNVNLQALNDYAGYFKVNTIGTLNILKYCHTNNIPKFLHTVSHRSVAGLWSKKEIISEAETRAIEYESDFSIYSIAESAAMDCMHFYRNKQAIRGIIFRLPSVFGYGPHLEGYKYGRYIKTGFQIFIEKALEGKTIEIWGDPHVGRDIIYVKDVVSAFLLAIKSPVADGLYNIASGYLLTLEEEVKKIIKAFSPEDRRSDIVYLPEKKNGIEQCQYAIDKARSDFGWSPRYTFSDMLDDYKLEMESRRYEFLLKKRRIMMEGEQK